MAVNLQVTDIKYFSEIKNGPTFALNPGDFGTHVKGNLIERLRADITVRIQTRMELLNWSVTNTDTLTINGGSFIEEGFAVGDTVFLTFNSGANHTLTITSLSPTIMVTTGSVLPNGNFGQSSTDYLRSLTPLDAIKYQFGYVGNDDPTTFISAIDQTTLAFKAEGMRAAAPSAVSAEWDGTIKGSQTGGLDVTFLADILDAGELDSGGSVIPGSPVVSIQEFKLQHTFNYPDWYLQGELDNIRDGLRPERIEAGIDLKQVVDFEFRTTLSNPNTSKTGRLDWILGKTNYFGENYSDDPTQYSVTDVVLTDLTAGGTVEGLVVGNTTRVAFSVLSANSTFVTAAPVVAYHNYLPSADIYQNSTETLTDNWILETLRQDIDAVATSGTVITNFTATLIGAGQIDCQFDIVYSGAQADRLDNNLDYLLAIGVADDTLSTDASDKTVLPIQVGTYTKDNDVPGLMDVSKLEVYTHPMTFTEGVTQGYTGFKGWVQDGIMWDWEFSLDRTLDAVLERFRVRLVALKTSDDTFFPLEDVEYDLSTQVITPGPPTIQQIEIDESRGFPLADGSIFNLKTFNTGAYSAPDITYTGQTAFKVNWQEWIALPGADTVFYNPAEPNDGLNEKASQYSLKSGYEIRLIIDADVSVGGQTTTNYIFKSPNATCLDFEEQDGTPITWTSTKETFDTSGANLGGKIQTTADTNLKFTFTPDIAPGLASLYWGIIRIEEVNNPGFAICELSTFRPSKDNNILKPLPGESFSKLSLNATVLCLECAVDYTKLDPSKSYNIYGRLGLLDQTPIPAPTIKVAVSGTTIQKDADFFVFQQTEIMTNAVLKDNFFNTVEGDYIFKVATDALVGGAPYDKSTWDSLVPVPLADFAALAAEIAASSDKWVYIEQDNTAYTIEGLIIEFERLALAQGTTTITMLMPVNSIDQDVKIWSDRKWEAVTATVGGSTEDGTQMELRTLDTTGEDWTLFPAKVTFGAITVNAVLAPSVDGVKHCLHIYRNFRNGSLINDVTIEMNYTSSEDVEKSMEITQAEIRPEWRPFGNCADWGPFPNVDQPYATTDPLDTALLDLLDVIQFGNPFSLSFWVMTQSGLLSNDRQVLWTPFDQGLATPAGNADGGSSLQLAFNSISGGKLFYALTENGAVGGAVQEWDGAYASAQRVHVVMTHDGSFNGPTGEPVTGVNMWINGRRNLAAETNFSASSIKIGLGGAGTSRPTGNMYYHGRWNLGALGTNKQPERTERIQAFNIELTAEDVLELYHNIDAARGGAPTVAGLFRDWDFSAHAAGVVPELTGSGFDMTITTGGAQPSNPDFY